MRVDRLSFDFPKHRLEFSFSIEWIAYVKRNLPLFEMIENVSHRGSFRRLQRAPFLTEIKKGDVTK